MVRIPTSNPYFLLSTFSFFLLVVRASSFPLLHFFSLLRGSLGYCILFRGGSFFASLTLVRLVWSYGALLVTRRVRRGPPSEA